MLTVTNRAVEVCSQAQPRAIACINNRPKKLAAAIAGLAAIVAVTLKAASIPPPLAPFEQQILVAHNLVRAQFQEPPLQWSPALAERARAWAGRLAEERRFDHSGSSFGENLYLIVPGPATPDEVVAAWAAEASKYDYHANSCRGVCGHYTQIIWRDTAKVGCGMARGSRREIWVCNYDPPGNYVGERPY